MFCFSTFISLTSSFPTHVLWIKSLFPSCHSGFAGVLIFCRSFPLLILPPSSWFWSCPSRVFPAQPPGQACLHLVHGIWFPSIVGSFCLLSDLPPPLSRPMPGAQRLDLGLGWLDTWTKPQSHHLSIRYKRSTCFILLPCPSNVRDGNRNISGLWLGARRWFVRKHIKGSGSTQKMLPWFSFTKCLALSHSEISYKVFLRQSSKSPAPGIRKPALAHAWGVESWSLLAGQPQASAESPRASASSSMERGWQAPTLSVSKVIRRIKHFL